jgi:hypothetical protein
MDFLQMAPSHQRWAAAVVWSARVAMLGMQGARFRIKFLRFGCMAVLLAVCHVLLCVKGLYCPVFVWQSCGARKCCRLQSSIDFD